MDIQDGAPKGLEDFENFSGTITSDIARENYRVEIIAFLSAQLPNTSHVVVDV